jgi:hypothetical protein
MGVTLGMTQAGRLLEATTEGLPYVVTRPLWEAASAEFAEGAQGVAHMFRLAGEINPRSIWKVIEEGILKGKGIDAIEHIVRGG